jgi:tetratricopeptide (TPR) repeat protein
MMPEFTKKSLIIAIYFALALSTLLVFWQVRNFDFISHDDADYVWQNPHVLNGLSLDGIIWAFTTRHSANWHPLTWLSLMLDCQLFGPNPGWIHFINLLLHLANTLLLFAVFKKMTASLWPSAFIAAVFALHPAHIESVAWVSERKDVLSTLFFILTLLAYAAYAERQTKLRYILVLASFALGLMAKPMLVTLPFVLLLLDYWPLGRLQLWIGSGTKERENKKTAQTRKSFGYLVWEKLPLFALSACSSAVTFYVQRTTGAVIKLTVLPFDVRFFNAIISYIKYIAKFFWPSNLVFLYPYPALPLPDWQIVASTLLLLAVSVAVFKLRRRKYLAVGWLWFLGTLVPVIGLVQVGVQAMADRYTYIPYIGLLIMVAWGMSDLTANRAYGKAIFTVVAAILIIAMTASAYFQLGCWKNSISLFSRAVEVTHDNRIARMAKNYLAWVLATSPDPNMRNPSEAIRIAKEVNSETNYKDASMLDTLGAAYASAGRFADAIETTQKALGLAQQNDKDLLGPIQSHLDLYNVSKPYIEVGPKAQNAVQK